MFVVNITFWVKLCQDKSYQDKLGCSGKQVSTIAEHSAMIALYLDPSLRTILLRKPTELMSNLLLFIGLSALIKDLISKCYYM